MNRILCFAGMQPQTRDCMSSNMLRPVHYAGMLLLHAVEWPELQCWKFARRSGMVALKIIYVLFWLRCERCECKWRVPKRSAAFLEKKRNSGKSCNWPKEDAAQRSETKRRCSSARQSIYKLVTLSRCLISPIS